MAGETNAIWRVEMFQGLRVQRGGRVFERFDTRRAASLLAYLAYYPHRAHPREELAEMLWPDENMDVTRLRLRQVLNSIRRAIDSPDGSKDGLLLTDRTFVRVNADVLTTDVREFEFLRKAGMQAEDSLRQTARLEQAAELYRGELLPGFYDDWIEQERRRLHEAHRETLLLLANALAQTGNAAAGLEHARKILAADPLDEEAAYVSIHLCAQSGRAGEALRQYQALEQALWKELRALPSPDLQTLAAQIRDGKITRVSPPTLSENVRANTAGAGADTSLGRAVGHANAPSALPAPEVEQSGEERPDEVVPVAFAPPLAVPLTPFFGRQQEIHDLVALLQPLGVEAGRAYSRERFSTEQAGRAEQAPRLVTLIGPGGTGKTRLAQEVARRLQPAYAQRAWFMSLAETQESALIPEKISDVLYLDNKHGAKALERIAETLNQQPALLVLDNFEQLTASGASIVRELLERAPNLRCLITSRQTLNVAGEQRVDVLPLPIPEVMEAIEEWEQIAQTPSVQLFADRARNELPQFEITAENAAAVADLCRYLEGFPLALELAAAWMPMLDAEQLLLRLQDRFTLLINQQSGAPTRHRSLYATIEWSYEQLPLPVQALFVGLSVFHGGWTLDAAEVVAEEPLTLVYMTQLLRHSMILREGVEAGGRFRMLETLRDFARAHVNEEQSQTLRRRHAAYFLGFAECASERLTGAEQSHWMQRLEEESANLWAAQDWCASQNNVEMEMRFVTALWRFWHVRSHHQEAEKRIESILSRAGEAEPIVRARFLDAAASLAMNQRRHVPAQERARTALSLYREAGDEQGMGYALMTLAASLRDSGDVSAAKPLFQQALALMKAGRDTFGIAMALGGLGVIADLEGDPVGAHSLLEQSGAMYRICGHRRGVGWCCYERGWIARKHGGDDLCLSMFLEGLPISRALHDAESIGYACFNIGAVHGSRGEYAQAEQFGLEALHAAQRHGLTGREVGFLVWLGDIACDQSRWARGKSYYRAVLLRSQQAQLHTATSMALERLAALTLLHDGEESDAACLYAAAQSLTSQDPPGLPAEPRFLNAELQTRLRAVYEQPAHALARARGQRMSAEQACAFALALFTP